MHQAASRLVFIASVIAASSLASCAAPTGSVPLSGDVPEAAGWASEVVVQGLEHPWSVAWLDDGSMLVTERAGRVRRVSAQGVLDPEPVAGIPSGEVLALGQGGLMDIALHPDFSLERQEGANRWVYLTYSTGTRDANFTRLARAEYDGKALSNWQTLYSVSQPKRGGQHFGSRILWLRPVDDAAPATMLLTIGDGGNPPVALDGKNIRDQAQNLGSALGKVLILDEQGKAVARERFAGQASALPEVFSYGHRNIQGIALDPKSGRIYANEHGARGGDELNVVEGGKNYGWPLVTYSREYMGPKISDETSRAGMVDPIVVWTPAQAPSGLAFYDADTFPAWQGDLFSGGLVSRQVRRIDLDAEGKVVGQEKLTFDQRVRDVRQGPDGFLYVLTDAEEDGRLIRVRPK